LDKGAGAEGAAGRVNLCRCLSARRSGITIGAPCYDPLGCGRNFEMM
jgi:hypothetical protein